MCIVFSACCFLFMQVSRSVFVVVFVAFNGQYTSSLFIIPFQWSISNTVPLFVERRFVLSCPSVTLSCFALFPFNSPPNQHNHQQLLILSKAVFHRQIPTTPTCNKIGCTGPNSTSQALLVVDREVLKPYRVKKVFGKTSYK